MKQANGLLASGFYQPPEILEPGQVAFFLSDKSDSLSLGLNIEVFQGPAGWLALAPPERFKDVTVKQGGPAKQEIDEGKTFIRVSGPPRNPRPAKYDTSFTFAIANDVIEATQTVGGVAP